MVDFLLDPRMNTEVRLASYMTVVQCVSDKQMETIVNAMSIEENTQGKEAVLWDCGSFLLL